MSGAERKLRKPLTPMMIPLRRRALCPNSELRILIIGAVITPQEKNCKFNSLKGEGTRRQRAWGYLGRFWSVDETICQITTWRKTATTACHVAGFLKEQAIPIPPILVVAFNSLSLLHVAQMSETSPGRTHPGATGERHSENSQFISRPRL